MKTRAFTLCRFWKQSRCVSKRIFRESTSYPTRKDDLETHLEYISCENERAISFSRFTRGNRASELIIVTNRADAFRLRERFNARRADRIIVIRRHASAYVHIYLRVCTGMGINIATPLFFSSPPSPTALFRPAISRVMAATRRETRTRGFSHSVVIAP